MLLQNENCSASKENDTGFNNVEDFSLHAAYSEQFSNMSFGTCLQHINFTLVGVEFCARKIYKHIYETCALSLGMQFANNVPNAQPSFDRHRELYHEYFTEKIKLISVDFHSYMCNIRIISGSLKLLVEYSQSLIRKEYRHEISSKEVILALNSLLDFVDKDSPALILIERAIKQLISLVTRRDNHGEELVNARPAKRPSQEDLQIENKKMKFPDAVNSSDNANSNVVLLSITETSKENMFMIQTETVSDSTFSTSGVVGVEPLVVQACISSMLDAPGCDLSSNVVETPAELNEDYSSGTCGVEGSIDENVSIPTTSAFVPPEVSSHLGKLNLPPGLDVSIVPLHVPSAVSMMPSQPLNKHLTYTATSLESSTTVSYSPPRASSSPKVKEVSKRPKVTAAISSNHQTSSSETNASSKVNTSVAASSSRQVSTTDTDSTPGGLAPFAHSSPYHRKTAREQILTSPSCHASSAGISGVAQVSLPSSTVLFQVPVPASQSAVSSGADDASSSRPNDRIVPSTSVSLPTSTVLFKVPVSESVAASGTVDTPPSRSSDHVVPRISVAWPSNTVSFQVPAPVSECAASSTTADASPSRPNDHLIPRTTAQQNQEVNVSNTFTIDQYKVFLLQLKAAMELDRRQRILIAALQQSAVQGAPASETINTRKRKVKTTPRRGEKRLALETTTCDASALPSHNPSSGTTVTPSSFSAAQLSNSLRGTSSFLQNTPLIPPNNQQNIHRTLNNTSAGAPTAIPNNTVEIQSGNEFSEIVRRALHVRQPHSAGDLNTSSINPTQVQVSTAQGMDVRNIIPQPQSVHNNVQRLTKETSLHRYNSLTGGNVSNLTIRAEPTIQQTLLHNTNTTPQLTGSQVMHSPPAYTSQIPNANLQVHEGPSSSFSAQCQQIQRERNARKEAKMYRLLQQSAQAAFSDQMSLHHVLYNRYPVMQSSQQQMHQNPPRYSHDVPPQIRFRLPHQVALPQTHGGPPAYPYPQEIPQTFLPNPRRPSETVVSNQRTQNLPSKEQLLNAPRVENIIPQMPELARHLNSGYSPNRHDLRQGGTVHHHPNNPFNEHPEYPLANRQALQNVRNTVITSSQISKQVAPAPPQMPENLRNLSELPDAPDQGPSEVLRPRVEPNDNFRIHLPPMQNMSQTSIGNTSASTAVDSTSGSSGNPPQSEANSNQVSLPRKKRKTLDGLLHPVMPRTSFDSDTAPEVPATPDIPDNLPVEVILSVPSSPDPITPATSHSEVVSVQDSPQSVVDVHDSPKSTNNVQHSPQSVVSIQDSPQGTNKLQDSKVGEATNTSLADSVNTNVSVEDGDEIPPVTSQSGPSSEDAVVVESDDDDVIDVTDVPILIKIEDDDYEASDSTAKESKLLVKCEANFEFVAVKPSPDDEVAGPSDDGHNGEAAGPSDDCHNGEVAGPSDGGRNDVDGEDRQNYNPVVVQNDVERPRTASPPEAPSPADSGISSPPIHYPNMQYPELVYTNRRCICDEYATYLCTCASVMYCSVECQKQDWNKHKIECRRRRGLQ